MNLLVIAGWVILSLVVLAVCGIPVMMAIDTLVRWDDSQKWTGSGYSKRGLFPTKRFVAWIVVFLIALTLSIYVVGSLIPSDVAAHCGVGTHYIETGSGKYRSWLCVAN